MTETIDSSTPGVLAQRFVDAFNARDEQALGKLYRWRPRSGVNRRIGLLVGGMLGDSSDCLVVARIVVDQWSDLGRWVEELAAQVLQQSQALGGHGEPAPAAGGPVEDGPHQRQAAGLAGQPADHLGPAAGFAEGALDEVGMPAPRTPQSAARTARSRPPTKR